jgi:hypothetical protein
MLRQIGYAPLTLCPKHIDILQLTRPTTTLPHPAQERRHDVT